MWVIHWDALENIFWENNGYSQILSNIWNFELVWEFYLKNQQWIILQNNFQEVALIVILSKQIESYQVESFYPTFSTWLHVQIKVSEVREDENELEAYIVWEIVTTHEIKRDILFVATDYILNKEFYKVWNTIDILLVATPVTFKIAPESFEVNYDEEMLGALGIEAKYDENGNLEPVKFYNHSLTYIVPTEESDIVYECMLDIESIEEFEFDSIKIKKLLVSVNLGQEDDDDTNIITFPLYANSEKFSDISLEKWAKIQWFFEFHWCIYKE